MDEQQIDLGGQRIAFRQSQGAERPVIFVHGNSCSSSTWSNILDGPFGQCFRCLALDLPGHGNRTCPKPPDSSSWARPRSRPRTR